jgi:O-antigen ligase
VSTQIPLEQLSDSDGASASSRQPGKERWDLAFAGIVAYLVIEYTRLAEMFPILRPLQPAKLAVAVSALGLLFSPRPHVPRSARATIVYFVLGCFLLAGILSASFANYPDAAWEQVLDIFRWCVVAFLIPRAVTSSWRMRLFTFVYLLLNLKLGQFAIRGYASLRAMGVDEQYMAVHGIGAGSTGFFGNAGDFGVAMCVVWPLAAAMFTVETKRWRKYVFALCFVVFLGAVVITGSRGAMLAAAVVSVVTFIRSSKKILGIVMMLVVLAAFFTIMSGASKARMQSALDPDHDATAADRIEKWKFGLRQFGAHPFLGLGPANFAPEYVAEHGGSERGLMAWAPHSIYLQGLAELGILGCIPLLMLFLLPFRLNAKTRKLFKSLGAEKTRRFEYQLALGLDLAMVAYLVSGAFLTVLYYPHLWFILGLSTALYTLSATNMQEAESGDHQLVTHDFAAGIGAIR